jgi:Leucine Rich repeat
METEDEQQNNNNNNIFIHRGVLDAIARLTDPHHRGERHKLIVDLLHKQQSVDRRSLEYLVNFLDNHVDSHEGEAITELKLHLLHLSYPSDGGLEVLRALFARNDTTLTKVTLKTCDFFPPPQLLTAFYTNRTITDLSIQRSAIGLQGVALGSSISGILQNMPQLQRLGFTEADLHVDGVRAFQPALRSNRSLKEFRLRGCHLKDDGFRLIADALVGNMTMEVVDVSWNRITAAGLDDIIRLLESTRLRIFAFAYCNYKIFADENATQHFVTTLQQKTSTVQELPEFDEEYSFSDCNAAIINNSLARNQQLNRVNLLLLAPQRQQQQQQQRIHAGAGMLKISHKAITKFATVPDTAGACAIFKLFQARPQLLERRLKRPPLPPPPSDVAAVAAALNPPPSKVLRSIASKL